MTKSILLPRAAATATAVLGACLLAAAPTASGFTPAKHRGGAESTPLDQSSAATGSHAAATSSSGGGPSLVRTIVGLAIVIAVIWGLSWILRQFKAGRQPQAPSGGLASVAALTLSSGRSVHLVRAGNDYVLLGSAEQGVVPIQRYTEQQAREAGLLDAAEARGPRRLARIPALLDARARRPAAGEESARVSISPVDPMHPRSASSELVERLRQWTVRR